MKAEPPKEFYTVGFSSYARDNSPRDIAMARVSVNVAMPAGLVVSELLTNALKHAFAGRDGGTISLHSLVDNTGCRVIVADDGIGLAPNTVWPKPGKFSAMIVQSLRQNAKAQLAVDSAPDQGMRVTIFFARSDAAA